MATTNYLFSLMKFIGTTAYAYGPIGKADNGDYGINNYDKATMQESSNYTNWTFYPLITDEVYNSGMHVSDVESNTLAITDSAVLLLKDPPNYTYDSEISRIFTPANPYGYGYDDNSRTFYHFITQTETHKYYMASPYSISDRGAKYFSRNIFRGSGSYGYFNNRDGIDYYDYQSGNPSNITSINFIKVDTATNEQYIPKAFGFVPRAELYNSAGGYVLKQFNENEGILYAAFDENDKILTLSAAYNDVELASGVLLKSVCEFGEWIISFNYSGGFKIFDSTFSTPISTGLYETDSINTFYGAYYDGASVRVFYSIYDTGEEIYKFRVADTTDAITWNHTTYGHSIVYDSNGLVVGDGAFYFNTGSNTYARTVDFTTFTDIATDINNLVYTGDFYIGHYNNDIKYSSDGITFTSYQGETDNDYAITSIISSNGVAYILSVFDGDGISFKIYKTDDGSSLELIDSITFTPWVPYTFYAIENGIIFRDRFYDGAEWGYYTALPDAMSATNTHILFDNKIIAIPNDLSATGMPALFYSIDPTNEENMVTAHPMPAFELHDKILDVVAATDGDNYELSVEVFINEVIYDGEKYVWLLLYTTENEGNSSNFGSVTVEIRTKTSIFDNNEAWNIITPYENIAIFGNRLTNEMAESTPMTHRSFHYNGQIYFILFNRIMVASKNLVDWFDFDLYSTDDFETATPIRTDNISLGYNLFNDGGLYVNSDGEFYNFTGDGVDLITNPAALFNGVGTPEPANVIANDDLLNGYVNTDIVGDKIYLQTIISDEGGYTHTIYSMDGANLIELVSFYNEFVIGSALVTYFNDIIILSNYQTITTIDITTGASSVANVPTPTWNIYTAYINLVTYNYILNTFRMYVYDFSTSMYYPVECDIDTGVVTIESPVGSIDNNEYYEIVYSPTENAMLFITYSYDDINSVYTHHAMKSTDGLIWNSTEITDIDFTQSGNAYNDKLLYSEFLERYIAINVSSDGSILTILSSENGIDWDVIYTYTVNNTFEDFPNTIFDEDGVPHYLREDEDIYAEYEFQTTTSGHTVFKVYVTANYQSEDESSGMSYSLHDFFYSDDLATFTELVNYIESGNMPENYQLFSQYVTPNGYHKSGDMLISAAITNRDISTTVIGISDHRLPIINYVELG